METIAEFWQRYTYVSSTIANAERYAGFHPDDLAHINTHYPHLFDSSHLYTGRKQNEIEKFRLFTDQVHGRYICHQNRYIRSSQGVNITAPDHYHGNLEEAKLLMLLINPLYMPELVPTDTENKITIKNMQLEKSCFAPNEFDGHQLNEKHHIRWWYDSMYQPLNAAVKRTILPNELMAIDFLPYRSIKRSDVPKFKELLPSQRVAMTKVREAIVKDINIIIRCTDNNRWLAHVPELKSYPKLYVFTNFKNPTLNPYEIMPYWRSKQPIYGLTNEHLRLQRLKDWELFIQPFQ